MGFDDLGADLGAAATAISGEEGDHRAEAVEIGPVEHRPALAPLGDEARANQDGEMRRHRVVGCPKDSGEPTRRDRFRVRLHEMTEDAEACWLGEGGQAFDGGGFIHVSGRTDIL